jgi:hypothetical protein
MTATAWDPWNYRGSAEERLGDSSLVGFTVRATDGDIGKVDEATNEVGASHLVVDTGPWIFGRKVLLPAATIERIDWAGEAVVVDRSKEQIKESPEVSEAAGFADPTYREQVGTYYGTTYGGLYPGR